LIVDDGGRVMGAKTGLLVFADRDIPAALRAIEQPDIEATADLVRRVYPGCTVEDAEAGHLADVVYPPDGMVYAAATSGLNILCDRDFTTACSSRLPPHLTDLSVGRRTVMHTMHSGIDYLGFAVWEDGELIRALTMSPGAGVLENIGEPFEFERPYWAGAHPVQPDPEWEADDEPYPLPFHPLDLGEEALRALFGFVIEDPRRPEDVDPDEVPLRGFRVAGPGQAPARETTRPAARPIAATPYYYFNADGSITQPGHLVRE
jgi:Family of unknown function (DUF6928)